MFSFQNDLADLAVEYQNAILIQHDWDFDVD
jgi:hypothetical protein